MALVEVKVPDIGDFKDVQIIELLVKPGDTVEIEITGPETGPAEKNRVSIEPTRFITEGTPAAWAAAWRPSPRRWPSCSRRS